MRTCKKNTVFRVGDRVLQDSSSSIHRGKVGVITLIEEDSLIKGLTIYICYKDPSPHKRIFKAAVGDCCIRTTTSSLTGLRKL